MKDRPDLMQTLPRNRRQQEAPLYIRWNPERTPYTIELKLELAKQLADEVRQSMRSGQEFGGVLIGMLPNSVQPTFRIDDIQMIPRRPEDGQVFLLSPRDHDRLVSTKWTASQAGRVPVGFFRTHARSGPLRPSLADRTLLAGDFDTAAYLLLLIEANERRTAAFFLGARGELADEPSVAEFRFEEAELTALPEIASERIVENVREPESTRGGMLAIAVVLLLLLGAAFYLWSGLSPDVISAPEQGLRLSASGTNPVRISWNRRSPDLKRAASGKLLVNSGGQKLEVTLGADELQFGAVDLQPASPHGEVTLVLTLPGDAELTQTVEYGPGS